jgi:uncharacterized membrane protein
MLSLDCLRGIRVDHHVAPVVYFHLFAALAALIVGTVQMIRPKGVGHHRLLGRVWVALMFFVAISSLWIPAFLHFSWIHLFTLATLVGLPLAVWRIRTGNIAAHARGMRGLYFGGLVIAGIFTLAPGRLLGNLLWTGHWGT